MVSRHPLGFPSFDCSGTEPFAISGTDAHSAQSVKVALKETQTTGPNQWPCLILSSSITGLLREEASVPPTPVLGLHVCMQCCAYVLLGQKQHHTFYTSSAVAEIGHRLATIDTG